jgi:predicted amidohydrolase YtcJ
MPPSPSGRAFLGGRVLTMDPRHSAPDVVIVIDDRIAAVGERALLAAHPEAAVEDLRGRTLVPGFIDAHNHLSIAALHPLWADLSQATTVEDLHRALAVQAAREPEAGWVRGAGWTETPGGLVPTRHDLDALGLDRPVLVAHFSLHQSVVCSRALDVLGIGRTTPDPPGGTIERGADGEPSGLLVERAWSDAHARSLAAYADPARWGDLIVARARALLREGITAVHDAACAPSAEAVYRRLATAGALPISVLVMPHPEAIFHAPLPERLDGPPTGEGDEWLRVGPVKLFADGGVAPALDVTLGGQRVQYGVRFPALEADLVRAVECGFRVAVHAMGNAGLAATLDAFASAARRRPGLDHRFRVEHGTLASRAQLDALAALGGIAVVQPGFVRHMGALVEAFQLEHETWLPFGDMARAGVALAASSDDPCALHEPVRTAAHGANRRTGSGSVLGPEQALAYEEWLRAYTVGAAYAGGQEDERGSITPGKRADLVVLEGDLDPDHPPRVAQTWIGGRRVFGD